ncbi:Calcium-transporting ATPase 1 [compost metagenome]
MPQPPPQAVWHRLTPEQALELLEVDPGGGLSQEEAARRLAAWGSNSLPQVPPPSLFELILRQIKSFIILLLLAAAALSFVLGEGANALAILAALLLNALVGVIMDVRAEREVASLRALGAPTARVRRGGNELVLPASEVVPGDVLVLEAGDRVPADARVIEGELRVDESLLTGESLPVTKRPAARPEERMLLAERRNEVFSGSLVLMGSGVALATATGARSEIGRIGTMLTESSPPAPPLVGRLDALGRYLVGIVGAVAAVLMLLGLWQGRSFWPLLEASIVLAIAAIPEGLPAVATLALAAGSRRLMARGLRLRSLGALEALGAATTLCLDKTGTLTANAMTVTRIRLPEHPLEVTGTGWEPVGAFLEGGQPRDPAQVPGLFELLRTVQLCNDATLEQHDVGWHGHGDPSEGALLVAAAKAGLPDPRPSCKREAVQPAGPGHPWMLVACDGTLSIKGAPEEVLARCTAIRMDAGFVPLSAAQREDWLKENQRLAEAALRVFGVAAGSPGNPPEEGWVFLGLVGMMDPPRPRVREALATAHRAGIRTIMITGDQPTTARAIARELDMADGREPRISLGAEASPVETDVYARTAPEGKLRLVQQLQESGEVVVMSGDGVNDAPALRAADVGVAMGRGSDVAKDAAALILIDERLDTLLEGVAEGRTVFFNIQKATDFLLTCSLTTMMAVLFLMAAAFPLPLLPLQILYLNLLTHTFPALGLALEPKDPEVLRMPPLPRQARLMPPRRLASILWHGVILSTATLTVGAFGLTHGGTAHGRTLVFSFLATALMLHTFSDRSPRAFGGWRWGQNPMIFLFVGLAVALQLLAIYVPPLRDLLGMTPLEGHDWLSVLVAALVVTVAIELSKKALPPGAV